jgi:hypothetical protein
MQIFKQEIDTGKLETKIEKLMNEPPYIKGSSLRLAMNVVTYKALVGEPSCYYVAFGISVVLDNQLKDGEVQILKVIEG